jgi:hypothetical protein
MVTALAFPLSANAQTNGGVATGAVAGAVGGAVVGGPVGAVVGGVGGAVVGGMASQQSPRFHEYVATQKEALVPLQRRRRGWLGPTCRWSRLLPGTGGIWSEGIPVLCRQWAHGSRRPAHAPDRSNPRLRLIRTERLRRSSCHGRPVPWMGRYCFEGSRAYDHDPSCEHIGKRPADQGVVLHHEEAERFHRFTSPPSSS